MKTNARHEEASRLRNGGLTLNEAGELLGVTKERVRQMVLINDRKIAMLIKNTALDLLRARQILEWHGWRVVPPKHVVSDIGSGNLKVELLATIKAFDTRAAGIKLKRAKVKSADVPLTMPSDIMVDLTEIITETGS